jgi:oligoribonuclease (3'-5' exoribonuclease)
MKFISLDLETTGLNPSTDQIIQFAAIMVDTEQPMEMWPAINLLVHHERYAGEAFALQMNQKILHKIATAKDFDFVVGNSPQAGFMLGSSPFPEPKHVYVESLWLTYSSFIHHYTNIPISRQKNVYAGFNIGCFDMQFLFNHISQSWGNHHRYLEVSPLYMGMKKNNNKVPSSSEVVRDLLGEEVSHDALQDALQAAKCAKIILDYYKERNV